MGEGAASSAAYCLRKGKSAVMQIGTPPVVRLDPELQDEWVKEQLQRRHSGQADAHAKEAAELREKLQEAQDELDSTRRDLSAAEKQAAETERALHRYTALSTSNADISQHLTAARGSGLSTAAALSICMRIYWCPTALHQPVQLSCLAHVSPRSGMHALLRSELQRQYRHCAGTQN